MGAISGYIQNDYMDEVLFLFHMMSLEVMMFGTDFPMFATSRFRLYARYSLIVLKRLLNLSFLMKLK